MAEISYRRHRFPPVTIQHAVWLYLRFTLSYRDVEELLAERGLDISYEIVPIGNLLSPPPLSPGDHPACGLALSALHSELSRRRGTASRARARHLLRNRSDRKSPIAATAFPR